MKYLKLFEDKEELFWKIDQNEYDKRIYGISDDDEDEGEVDEGIQEFVLSHWENFNQFELSKLELLGWKYKPVNFYIYDIFYYNMTPEESKSKFQSIEFAQVKFFHNVHSSWIYSFKINKLKDEWYYIYTRNGTKYKCDQFDGLIECLEYLKREDKI